MPYQPKRPDEFFRKLGLKTVARAHLNGEFTGNLNKQASLWIEDTRHHQSMFWTRLAAIAGVLALIGLPLALLQLLAGP